MGIQNGLKSGTNARKLLNQESKPEFLQQLIDSTNKAKEEQASIDEENMKMYPETFIVDKLQQMKLKKQGLSDFEIYSGTSESFGTLPRTSEFKRRFIEPRTLM
jgi:hypothetical protein